MRFDGATADLTGANSVTISSLFHTAGTLTLDHPKVLVRGDFTRTGGTFIPGTGKVVFGGASEQNLDLSVPTDFFALKVTGGTTLIETQATDRASVAGLVSNSGIIRKTKSVPVSGAVTFGLTGVELDIKDPGNFTSLQVDQVGANHPSATTETATGRYWALSPVGEDYTVDLTLPHCIQPAGDVDLCRWTGASWDCAADLVTPTEITRTDVTQLSDWTLGFGAPYIMMTGFECGTLGAWSDTN